MQNAKAGILSQKPSTLERKLRLRWVLLASTVPLFGIITSFALAPLSLDQNVSINTVTESISLPDTLINSDPASITAVPIWQADQVQRDDTLSTLLARLNIRNSEAIDFLKHSPQASILPSQLRPGRYIYAKTLVDGTLIELMYQISTESVLHVVQSNQGYLAEQSKVALETRTIMKSSEIQSSLFAATDSADIPDHIAMQLAEIFSSDIDFHQDLRKGDLFSVVYEASYHDGELIKTGNVLAAEFVNQGKTYRAALYRGPNGQMNYYTPDGKSLHKAFLRSPLEFSRISSGFTLARFHPILQQWRAHKGVDYAAPIGTHVKSTADGTVQFVGAQNGYGNVVILQHAGGISTVYGHLSHFAPGLHKGLRISQGETIGQVGMSGMATGPHLHYEFRVHGEHRDPLKVALPTATPLSPFEMHDFIQKSKPILSQLDLLNHTNIASSE